MSIPEFRGHERNPVTYGDTDSLKIKGLDISKLKFKPMPLIGGDTASPSQASTPTAGYSIEEAKKGLSLKYGIPEANIQIVMTG